MAKTPKPYLVDIMALLVGLGAGLVLALTLQAQDWSSINDPGGLMTFIGRITGMIGTYLILILVLLVGRFGPLEKVIGQDRLLRWHRKLAPNALLLLLGHAITITIGYAQAAHTGIMHQFGVLLSGSQGVLMATVGLGLLVLAAVSSYRFAKKRVKHETWWVIHLYTYLALAFSFLHQIALGPMFQKHPVSQAFWIMLWLSTAGVVLAYRVLIPLVRSLRHNLKIIQIKEISPGVVSIICEGRKLDKLGLLGGQFFQWRFMTREMWWQAHPYSASALPQNDRYLRITVKDLGDHSRELAKLKKGTRVWFEGPYGAFTHHVRQGKDKVLLIGAGVGVTPIRALLEDLPTHVHSTVVLRANKTEELILDKEIEGLSKMRSGNFYAVVGLPDRVSFGKKELLEIAPDIRQRDVYVCGPKGFMQHIQKSLAEIGLPKEQFHYEDFAV